MTNLPPLPGARHPLFLATVLKATVLINYSNLLKDPRWQKKRLEILNRDNFACRFCAETTRTLHVHYREYVFGRKPWEYDNASLETLCDLCHEAYTQMDRELKEIERWVISALRQCSFHARINAGDLTPAILEKTICEMVETRLRLSE